MRQLLIGPGQELAALLLEKQPQRVGLHLLGENGFLLAGDVEIDQGQCDLGQTARLAQQPAVNPDLGPMQMAVVGRLPGQIAAMGLDFFELVAVRIVAIGPAAHRQSAVFKLQRDLGLIADAAPCGDSLVAGNSLARGRRGGEAQIEVALLGGEIAQGPHGNHILHAAILTGSSDEKRGQPAARTWCATLVIA